MVNFYQKLKEIEITPNLLRKLEEHLTEEEIKCFISTIKKLKVYKTPFLSSRQKKVLKKVAKIDFGF